MPLKSTSTFRILFSYVLALVLSAAAFAITYWLTPILQNAPFDLFQCAVVICAIYGGLGPALLATILSIMALDYFFMPPYNAFSLAMADLLQLVVFGTVALVISSLSIRLKKATQDLRQEVGQRLDAEKEILQISSREQRRLGEDLHDGLCQTLAGARLLSQDLKNRLLVGDSEWSSDAERIETRLVEALTQADVAARGLYPVELESNGLMAALKEYAARISAIRRVQCRFRCQAPVLVHDTAIATHLYRIVQEAVTNSIKRGKARRISVQLVQHNDYAVLSVTDDGAGLQAQPPRKGMGVKIMEYRARMINASLQLRSRKKGCTRLTCRFQMDASRVA